MPLLDVKAIFSKASKSRRKAQERIAVERRRKESCLPPLPKKKKKKNKKLPPKRKARQDDEQLVCCREGCWNPGPFSSRFCHACYDALRYAPKGDIPCTEAIKVDHQFNIEDYVLISNSHKNKELRGLFGYILRLEDNKTIAVVKLDGLAIRNLSRKDCNKFAGRELRVIVEQLLGVEL